MLQNVVFLLIMRQNLVFYSMPCDEFQALCQEISVKALHRFVYKGFCSILTFL
jgi:hypothetical protein